MIYTQVLNLSKELSSHQADLTSTERNYYEYMLWNHNRLAQTRVILLKFIARTVTTQCMKGNSTVSNLKPWCSRTKYARNKQL